MISLYLDDVRQVPDDSWTLCRTVAAAKLLLLAGDVEHASLDHDLDVCPECHGDVDATPQMIGGQRVSVFTDAAGQTGILQPCIHESTGMDLVMWMVETGHWPKRKPLVHSANHERRLAMIQVIERHWRAP